MMNSKTEAGLPDFLVAAIKQASKGQLASALELLLEPYILTTVRGAHTHDHEVAAVRAMEALNTLKQRDDEYDYMLRLRVTRTKARNLVYQLHLQQLESEAPLDDLVREVMAAAQYRKGHLTAYILPPKADLNRPRFSSLQRSGF